MIGENKKQDIIEELKARNREISEILEATRIVMEKRTFEDTARAIFDSCKRLTGATSGYVALLSKDGQENDVLFLDSGGRECTVDESLPMPIRGLRAEAYKMSKVVYDNDFDNSDWMKFMPDGHMTLDNVLFAPLKIGNKTEGIIGIANKPGGFDQNDASVVANLGDHLAIALHNSWTLESLERQEKQFRSVVETAREAIISVNSDDEIIFWNKGAETIFGYSSDEMMGKSVTKIMPKQYRDLHKKGLRRVIKTGKSRVIGKTVELLGLKKEGGEFPVELSLAKWKVGGETFFTSVIRDIEERKNADDVLKKTLFKAQQYLDVAGVILVVIDADQKVSLINKKGSEVLGYNEREIVGKNWFDNFIPEDMRVEVKKAFSKFMAGEIKPVEYFENSVLNRNGEERVISWHNVLLRDKDGEIIGALSSGEDITEKILNELELEKHRMHLEELVEERTRELKESESRYRAIIESVTDYIYSVTVENGRPVSSSHGPGCIAVTGYKPKDYQGDSDLWFKMIHYEDREMVSNNISMLLSGKEVAPFEHRIIHKNGSLRWIRNTPVLRLDEKGSLISYDGLVRDITVRKKAEESLLKSNKMLDAINRAQGGVISEADPQAIFSELLEDFLPLTESEFGFIAELEHMEGGAPYLKLMALTNIAWNEETRALFHRFREDGMEFRNMNTLFGAVVKTGEVVISNDPENDPRSGGLPTGHPPLNSFIGIPYPIKGKMTGIVCAANRPGGYSMETVDYLKPFLATCSNMVEAYRNRLKRKKAEEAIRQYTEELKESNRMKDLFTDIMRHDLMNPASLVMNFAEILMSREEDPQKRDIIEEINCNTDKLIQLIDDASKYSRLKSLEKVDRNMLDLASILKETIHGYELEVERKNIDLRCLPKKKYPAPVNKIIGEVFSNLVSNAIKYSPEGSRIDVGIRSRGENWLVYVKDFGEGIAHKDRERIFERFERAAKEGDKGYGLGLAIAKRIIDLHDGKIWVEDNPEGGSIFLVSLPKAHNV
ncbi:MAG: PAS domain S-box protein [bacterium]|nr:PAS domain S-box protein [bacterium]